MIKLITKPTLFAVLMLLVLMIVAVDVQAHQSKRVLAKSLTLYEGESKVITAPDVERISVGKSELVSTTLLKNGEIVLNADGAGETNMQVWFTDGRREILALIIVSSDGWREASEIRQLLKDVQGIKVTTLGRRVVIDGELKSRDLDRVNILKERYSDILVLARAITTDQEVLEIRTLLKSIAGIKISVIDQQVVVDGNLQKRDLERIKLIQERYPNILVLAREITAFEEKMIYFDVRVTEFSKDYTENIGINWQKSFGGPVLNLAKNVLHAGDATPDFSGSSTVAAFNNFQTATSGSAAYFGIATELTSIINLLEQSGAALTLAHPRLSARSGGSADLTVGGEVPVVTSSINGTSVEYKDFGILLKIEPTLDTYNNITARVDIAISQLDLANAVNGQPAFKKRSTVNDVKLRPGETLVLSGLITREEQKTSSNVKWLSSIPVLGNLFKSKSFVEGETEMVIFITPTILEKLDEGINQQEIDSAARMVDLFDAQKTNGLMD